MKLRLAGAQEDIDLQASHARQLEARCDTLEAQKAAFAAQIEGLKAQMEGVRGQLDEVAALKSGTEQEAERLKVRRGAAQLRTARRRHRLRTAGGPACRGKLRVQAVCVLILCPRQRASIHPLPPPTLTLTTRRRTWALRARTSAA